MHKSGKSENKTCRCFEKEHYAWNKAGNGEEFFFANMMQEV
jgi:hypothetical protein